MSESGERDGKKPTPRAEPGAPGAADRTRDAAIPAAVPPSGSEDLAMWEATTTVRGAPELLLRDGVETATPPLMLPPRPPQAAAAEVQVPPAPAFVSVSSSRSEPQPHRNRDPVASEGPGGMEMGRPIFAVAMVGLLASVGAWATVGVTAGIGVAVGAAFATANLWAFTRIGRGVVGRNAIGWGLVAAAKLLLLFGGAFAVLTSRLAAPLPFLVGYLGLPVGIVLSQVLGLKSEFEDGEGSI